MNQEKLIEQLSLVEHIEGGFFRETYRSQINVPTDRTGNQRSLLTCIYYLLTKDNSIDYFHKNTSDIVHFFQLGSPLTFLLINPDGKLEKIKLGSDLTQNHQLQIIVPAGYWKAVVLEEGKFGLLAEAVAPGFDYRDMEIGTADYFQARFPDLWLQLKLYVKS